MFRFVDSSTLRSFHFAGIGLILVPCCRLTVRTRIEGMKNLSSCLTRGPDNYLYRNTTRGKTLARFLCIVSSVLKFIRFLVTTALQHAKLLSADFSALARRVRFPMGREPPQGYPPVADRREAVARVVRLPPPYRFNCLWTCSFHFSFHDSRLDISDRLQHSDHLIVLYAITFVITFIPRLETSVFVELK